MTKLNKETLEYFLSEDFTNWLLTSLKDMHFNNNTQDRLSTFYDVINHYIELNNIEYELIEDNNNSITKGYFIKFNDNYGEFIDKFYESEYDCSMKRRIYLHKVRSDKTLGKDVIDIEELTHYAIDLLCKIKDIDIQKKIMTTIEELKQNGVNTKEILNNLQIAYTTLANEEIRKR